MGDSSEKGRKELPWPLCFPGFRIGTTRPNFHILEITSVFKIKLRKSVRYCVDVLRCFFSIMSTGPSALEVLVASFALHLSRRN